MDHMTGRKAGRCADGQQLHSRTVPDIGTRNARHELTSWNREQYHVPDYPLALPVTAASPHDAGFSVYTDGLFGWLTLRSRFDTRFRYDGSHERELHPSAVA